MLGVFVGFYHIDSESVFTRCREDIDAAGFHCWPGFVWVPASFVEGTGVA